MAFKAMCYFSLQSKNKYVEFSSLNEVVIAISHKIQNKTFKKIKEALRSSIY